MVPRSINKTEGKRGANPINVCVLSSLYRPFYPAAHSSVHPASVPIPYPRETLLMQRSQTVRQGKTEKKNSRKFMGKASKCWEGEKYKKNIKTKKKDRRLGVKKNPQYY